MYIASILLPISVIIIEYALKITFTEILGICAAKIQSILKKDDNAKKILIDLNNKYPNNISVHKQLAKIFEKENEKEKAIEQYEIILSINDNPNINTYMKLGKLYIDINESEKAKRVILEALNENQTSCEASILLGEILCMQEEYKEAVQIYIGALKYNPADYDLYYHLGMAYTMLNDFQKAKESYETAANINSDLYHAKYTLGQLSMIYGELDEAVRYFDECLNYEEVESGAYYYLAKIAIIKGELEKAINYADVAIEEDKTIYDKIQKDNIFVVIRNKVKKPKVDDTNIKKVTLNKEEMRVSEHLDNTYGLVGKLNNNDLQMIENIMKTKEVSNDIEKEKD